MDSSMQWWKKDIIRRSLAKVCPLIKLLPKFERVFETAVWGEADCTGDRTNWRNGAVSLQNSVGAGNCTKVGRYSAMWNREAGFYALKRSPYGGRTVSHKRNSENARKEFSCYYLIDEEKVTVWVTAVIYGRRDQITALLDMSLNDTEWLIGFFEKSLCRNLLS